MSSHSVPVRVYLAVFSALMVLTAVTIWIAFIDLGVLNTVVAISIACVKAVLVILYFMHARYGSRLIWVVISGGAAWFVLLIALVMCDYVSRGWLPYPGK